MGTWQNRRNLKHSQKGIIFKMSLSLHVKAYLNYMKLTTYKAQELIILPKDTALIVLGGVIKMQKFNCKTKKSLLCSLLLQGDFIWNFKDFKPPTDFWIESVTDTQLLLMDKKHFEVIWELTKQKERQNIIRMCIERFNKL